jgi:hypothetical protein
VIKKYASKPGAILCRGVKGFPGAAVLTSGMKTVNKFYLYMPKMYQALDFAKDVAEYYGDAFLKTGHI